MTVPLPRQPGIYRLLNTSSGHSYVGRSVDMYLRAYNHIASLNKGTHHARHLQMAWLKYGQSAFTWQVLELVQDIRLLAQREQRWIDTLHPVYNTSPTADGGILPGTKLSPEIRAKMSAAHKGKSKPNGFGAKVAAANRSRIWTTASREKASLAHNAIPMPWKHRPRTEATIAKIRAAKLGRRLPDELRAKFLAAGRVASQTPAARAKRGAAISARRRGKPLSEAHKVAIAAAGRGRTHSPETRAKISAANRGKTLSPETKAKLSAAQIGRHHTPETRAKMSAAHRGMNPSPQAIAKTAAAKRGRKATEQTRANLRAAWQRRKAKATPTPHPTHHQMAIATNVDRLLRRAQEVQVSALRVMEGAHVHPNPRRRQIQLR